MDTTERDAIDASVAQSLRALGPGPSGRRPDAAQALLLG